MGRYRIMFYTTFQSTLPRRERQERNRQGKVFVFCFNPRSHEGSDGTISRFHGCWKSFNPRSHEGSDETFTTSTKIDGVSIHAPTKGATLLSAARSMLSAVSIHAPTKGATCPISPLSIPIAVSIHAPTKGATRLHCFRLLCRFCVSIHAPTKGATLEMALIPSWFRVSIHAPTKGATSCTSMGSRFYQWFQSTLPRRERLRPCA